NHSTGGSHSTPVTSPLPGSQTPDGTGSPPSTSGSDTPTTTAPASSGASRPTSSAATSPAKSKVDLIVTYSGWTASTKTAEVDAFAPDVLVSNAKCTLTLTRAGVTRTASRPASASASTTQCGALTVPGSQLVAGDWTAVVRFDSPSAAGSSTPVTIRVT